MRREIVGVVLAAGESQRMGRTPKQLLRFGDRTMAATVVAHAEASQLDRVVVVTGHHAETVTGTLAPRRAAIVHNSEYRRGNVSSLERGLSVAGDPDGVLLLLGDMPGVDTSIIDAMVDAWRSETPWAAVAVYNDGVPNHPFLLSRNAIEVMREHPPAKVLWRLLVEAPPQPVLQVRFDRDAPMDVDTEADYGAALRQLGLDAASG